VNIQSKKKKVLIVSHLFPPGNTVGAVRIGKFVKYLPEFGWQPIVLTAECKNDLPSTLPMEADDSYIIRTPSYSLASKVTGEKIISRSTGVKTIPATDNKHRRIYRKIFIKFLRLLKPFYSLPVIERLLFENMGWKTRAVRAGLESINKNKIDVIFSSFGPAVSHLVASQIQREAKIPWLAEFRDPWSHNEYYRQTQPFHFIEELWEKRTLDKAKLLITVSQTWANSLELLHPKPTIIIPNGFDEEDYLEKVPLTEKFTITYTGNIYPGKRDPEPLLKAIAILKQEGKINQTNFELRFFGNNVNQHITYLTTKYDINNLVNIYGFVSFKESIRRQKESSALLLLSWNNPKDAGTLTGKVFEYIGASRPILALAYQGGEIDKLLQKTGCGVVANDPEEILDVIDKWLEEYGRNKQIKSFYKPKNELIKNYTRREQAKQLAEALNTVINQQSSPVLLR